jgi:UDP-glucose 4-epimerase
VKKEIDTSSYKNKSVLVTGGGGYIGSSLIQKLRDIPCKIILLSRNKSQKNLIGKGKAKITIRQGDIRDPKIWPRLLKGVDIVFHFAAQTSSKVANENPVDDIQINLLPIVALIEACLREKHPPAIIFSGTVTQVGLTKTYPVNEVFQDRPITVYDINKLAAEKYLQYYAQQLGGKAVTLRLANVYGPGPESSSADRGILNLFVQKAIRGESLTVYGKGDFVRDYVYIDDVINAFLAAGVEIKKTSGHYYVIGSGVGHTFAQMTRMVTRLAAKKTGKKVRVAHIRPPENLSLIESRNFVANYSKFKQITGWKPKISLRSGVSKTVDFYMGKLYSGVGWKSRHILKANSKISKKTMEGMAP